MVKENENIVIDCNEEIRTEYMQLLFKKIQENLEEFKIFFGVKNVKIIINLLSKKKLDEVAKIKTIQYRESEVPSWLVRIFNIE